MQLGAPRAAQAISSCRKEKPAGSELVNCFSGMGSVLSYTMGHFVLVQFNNERQCMYNATLRGVRVTIVAVENHEVSHILRTCL
jgi:hypothetical protein